jgi:hypothetical protein
MKQTISGIIGILFILCISAAEVLAQDNNSSTGGVLLSIWDTDKSGPRNAHAGESFNFEVNTPGIGGDSDDVNDVPVDGGLGFLLAAGAGYVANMFKRKLKKSKNEKNGETETIN